MSVVIHEVSHGFVAFWLGDSTAKYMGRLTLNPIKHIDPIGSILVPLVMFLFSGFAIGWAKPVPYNPYNLRDQRYGPAIVGVSGPLSNILIALVFGFFLRVLLILGLVAVNDQSVIYNVFYFAVLINIVLAVFNMLPIPPFDGSKLLFAIFDLPEQTKYNLERMGMFFFIIVIYIFSVPIGMLIQFVVQNFFKIVVGI
jgi:Zn-dependent protease